MIRSITAQNVNYAFVDGLAWLKSAGVTEQSRNGPVLVAPGSVVTTYLRPRERVLFNPVRDANPVFHLMEAIWMLAGENHVEWLLQFNKRFAEYAEADGVAHGAYGFRWRDHFGKDQIEDAIEMLKKDPTSRRVVIGMWDPAYDMRTVSRDLPCNTHIYFDMRGGKLNMTVCNRSNDMLWGAYGANVVHMSILQEVIAAGVEAQVGEYRQFSNNFHLYTDLPQVQHLLNNPPMFEYDHYHSGLCRPMDMINDDAGETWQDCLDDCSKLTAWEYTRTPAPSFATEFFRKVAVPLFQCYLDRKKGHDISAKVAQLPQNVDWVLAFTQWLDRRSGE